MSDDPTPMPTVSTTVLGAYLIILNLFLIYLLLKVWPGTLPIGDHDTVYLFGGSIHFALWIETRYLLISAVAGALGSYVHLATSFADFLGNRQLVSSWLWWYMLRPFIGMALALLMYFAIRGGLIASNATAQTLSPYGIAAITGLSGLFSKQATDKLKEVFESLFKSEKPPDRADKLSPQGK